MAPPSLAGDTPPPAAEQGGPGLVHAVGLPSSCAPIAPKLAESTQSELSRMPGTMDGGGGGALAAGHGAARRQGGTEYPGDGRPSVTMAEVLHGAGVYPSPEGTTHVDRMALSWARAGGMPNYGRGMLGLVARCRARVSRPLHGARQACPPYDSMDRMGIGWAIMGMGGA